MTAPIADAATVSQTDYLKLFMQELTYQDPLKPIDNREFMTQMAQFSLLQEAKTTNDSLYQLVGMHIGTQSLSLLGKRVMVAGANSEGTVTKVEFSDTIPPKISVAMKNNEVSQVQLSQISEVRS